MVRIDVEYKGELRCEALHTPSGQSLFTDAPVDNRGRGQSFSPTDLVATALGACMSTILGIYADDNGISLEGMRISVEKTMSADPPRRIVKLAVHFHMPPGIEPKARRSFPQCAHFCPVKQSLHPGIEIPVTFEYPD